jgi:hypothetical protein
MPKQLLMSPFQAKFVTWRNIQKGGPTRCFTVHELSQFAWILTESRPERVLEIGSDVVHEELGRQANFASSIRSFTKRGLSTCAITAVDEEGGSAAALNSIHLFSWAFR